ncbi:hypothetical protein RDI58_009602 [Solanum bulbocastanum]|uniref:Uncharacterized protein n=1 Tax=Solanum bulbocastanum TaxID=147425 RepID=A0AAN8TV04_SOLBU
MLPPEAKPRIESPNCSRATRKGFFNQKEFGSDGGYLSRSFRNSIIDDSIIKDLTFSNSVSNSLEARETKRRCVRTRVVETSILEDQSAKISMSGYDILSFFLLTESVTFISRFIFCAFPDQTRSYQGSMHSTE